MKKTLLVMAMAIALALSMLAPAMANGFDKGDSDRIHQDVRVDYTGSVKTVDSDVPCYLTRTRHIDPDGDDTSFTNHVQCDNGYAHTAIGIYESDQRWERSDGAIGFPGFGGIKLLRLNVAGEGRIDTSDCDEIDEWVTFPGCDDD